MKKLLLTGSCPEERYPIFAQTLDRIRADCPGEEFTLFALKKHAPVSCAVRYAREHGLSLIVPRRNIFPAPADGRRQVEKADIVAVFFSEKNPEADSLMRLAQMLEKTVYSASV